MYVFSPFVNEINIYYLARVNKSLVANPMHAGFVCSLIVIERVWWRCGADVQWLEAESPVIQMWSGC